MLTNHYTTCSCLPHNAVHSPSHIVTPLSTPCLRCDEEDQCSILSAVFLQSDHADTAQFCAATIQGWLLLEGGMYFLGKPTDTNDGWIRYVRALGKPTDTNDGWIRYVRAIQWWVFDAVNSKHSLSVLQSAVEMSHTTRTVLVLVRPLSSEIVHICVRVRGYYLRMVFISLRIPNYVVLFRGVDYSRKCLFEQIQDHRNDHLIWVHLHQDCI